LIFEMNFIPSLPPALSYTYSMLETTETTAHARQHITRNVVECFFFTEFTLKKDILAYVIIIEISRKRISLHAAYQNMRRVGM